MLELEQATGHVHDEFTHSDVEGDNEEDRAHLEKDDERGDEAAFVANARPVSDLNSFEQAMEDADQDEDDEQEAPEHDNENEDEARGEVIDDSEQDDDMAEMSEGDSHESPVEHDEDDEETAPEHDDERGDERRAQMQNDLNNAAMSLGPDEDDEQVAPEHDDEAAAEKLLLEKETNNAFSWLTNNNEGDQFGW